MDQLIFEFKISWQRDTSYRASVTVFGPKGRAMLTPDEVSLDLDFKRLLELTSQDEEYSSALTTMVFRPELAAALGYAHGYLAGAGSSIMVRLALDPKDSRLHAVRWELLRDTFRQEYLSTSARITFARTLLSREIKPRPPAVRPELRALIAAAEPAKSPLKSEHPWLKDEVQRAVLGLGQMNPTILDGQAPHPPASLAAIKEELEQLRPHIFYLVCHGKMVDDKEAFLYLEPADPESYRPTSAADLVAAIQSLATPPLLVILLCVGSARVPRRLRRVVKRVSAHCSETNGA